MNFSKSIKCLLIIGLFFLPFCEEDTQSSDPKAQWLIPENEIRDGGPGKDGIVAISDPNFVPLSQAANLEDSDLVVGILIGDTIRAFPHPILDHHEIINFTAGGTSIALSYCPLTGSAMAWDTGFLTENPTFGVSGLLYNSNLILYDRQTDSSWSQMLLLSVNGELVGREPSVVPVVETTWGTWKLMFPFSQVMSEDTGFHNDYSVYPYGDYKSSDSLIFPVNNSDGRLHKKERVFGIILNEVAKVYPIKEFAAPLQVINDEFQGRELAVVGSASQNFAVVFDRRLSDGTLLTFSAVPNVFPILLQDQEGGFWDIFGRAVSGSRSGVRLGSPRSYSGYWFAWAAFYPDAQIHGEPVVLSTLGENGIGFRDDQSVYTGIGTGHKSLSRFKTGGRLLAEWPQLRKSRFGFVRGYGKYGIRLDQFSTDSVLSDLGLETGDILFGIDDISFDQNIRFADLLARILQGGELKLEIERQGILTTQDVFLK